MLSDKAKRLLEDRTVLTVATLNPDGSPQTTLVWGRTDGDDVVFSTVKGRRKYSNLLRDPRVSVSAFDPDDTFTRVEIRGRATVSDDPDGALIDELSRKYTGSAWTEADPAAQRVIVRITPEKVVES
ncbi:PPOX class F420-dependent oxidoreductase [Nocardia heshunensis]